MANRVNSTTEAVRSHRALIGIEYTPPEHSALSYLEQERQRLQERIRQQDWQLATEGLVVGNDLGDLSARTYAQSKQLAMRRLWTAMLEKVEDALERLHQGMYGICECCGCPIPKERLSALPSATLCVSCSQLQARNVHAV